MRAFLAITTLICLSACSNSDSDSSTAAGSEKPVGIPAPQNINFSIIGTYPHDTSAYTQGLEIYKGTTYESTGDYENSSLRVTDIKTGKVLQKHMMGSSANLGPAAIFGEGITILNDKIYQLTWKNKLVNVYDLKDISKPIRTFTWPHEGWGITHNGTDLIISDGSANIYFVNPQDFAIKSSIQVRDNIGPINAINELEYIDGFVFANVYGSDYIIKINPADGHVVGNINLPGLIQQYATGFSPDDNEVLNGIAWDSASKKLYITGKHWPKMFELLLNN